MLFPRHKPLSGLPAKHTRRLEDELRALELRMVALEEAPAPSGGITPAYFHVSANADVDPDGTSWEGVHNRYTLVDGVSLNITRASSTFTFSLAGQYLWVVAANFTSNTTILAFRVREGSTTHATWWSNTISNTTNEVSGTAVVDVDAGDSHELQIVASAASNNLPQQSLDGQVLSNLNVSIVRVSES